MPQVAVDSSEHDPSAERDGAGAEHLNHPNGGASFSAAARMSGGRPMKSSLDGVGDGALRRRAGASRRRCREVLREEDAGAGEGEDGDDEEVRVREVTVFARHPTQGWPPPGGVAALRISALIINVRLKKLIKKQKN